MKRAVILHGTGNSPEEDWHPWLQQALVQHGFSVLHPELPENTTPNRQVYNDFLLSQEWDYTDNVMFGHSSGATAIFNFLMDERSLRIKAAVLLASFTELSPAIINSDWYQPGQFDNLFPPEGFDWELIKSKCDVFYFVHGSDDPFCSIDVAHATCQRLGGSFLVTEGGGHLGNSSGLTEIPQMINLLAHESVL